MPFMTSWSGNAADPILTAPRACKGHIVRGRKGNLQAHPNNNTKIYYAHIVKH